MDLAAQKLSRGYLKKWHFFLWTPYPRHHLCHKSREQLSGDWVATGGCRGGQLEAADLLVSIRMLIFLMTDFCDATKKMVACNFWILNTVHYLHEFTVVGIFRVQILPHFVLKPYVCRCRYPTSERVYPEERSEESPHQINVSVHASVRAFHRASVRPSARLSVRLSVCLSVCPYICLSLSPSIRPSVRQ